MEQEEKLAIVPVEKSNVIALIPKKKVSKVEAPPKIDPLKPIENPLKTTLVESAKNFINEYEKYTAVDYANLFETIDSLAKELLEKDQFFKSYKVYHAKVHLNQRFCYGRYPIKKRMWKKTVHYIC